MSKPLVVLDPGHGGRQPGAVANGLQEKELNLQLAIKVAERLKGVKAVLTRDEDLHVTLSRRVEIAGETGADLFVSLHANAGGGHGFESFVYRGVDEDCPALQKQEVVHNQIMKTISRYDIRDRGKKKANFYVLRNNPAPAVLVESLFIDHEEEAELWKDEEFVESLSRGVAAGIEKALIEEDGANSQGADSPGKEEKEEKEKKKETGIKTGKVLYCVQVGAFAVRDNARSRLKEARNAGFSDAFIYEKKA